MIISNSPSVVVFGDVNRSKEYYVVGVMCGVLGLLKLSVRRDTITEDTLVCQNVL